jgi:hypothetical protein
LDSKTKGQNFLGMLKRFEVVHGAELAASLHEHLDPALENALKTRQLLAGGMYPLAWYSSLHRAMRKVTGGGPDVISNLSRLQTRDDLSGVYRIFLLVMSPQAVIKKGNAIIAAYFSVGRLDVRDETRGFARGRFNGFTGFDRNLWADIHGSVTGALEAAGAADVHATTLAGGDDGDDAWDVEFRWK